MVIKKKMDNGFNGFRVPVIPRAPRSVRRRGRRMMAVENNRLCALASLAGMLLQESESSSSNASEGREQPVLGVDIDRREQSVFRPLKLECIDRRSSEESVYVSELATQKVNQKCVKKECAWDESDSECKSIVSSPVCLGKVNYDAKPVQLEGKAISGNFACKLEGTFPVNREHYITNVDNGVEKKLDVEDGSAVLTNPMAKDIMPNIGNSAKLGRKRSPVNDASFSRHWNHFSLGSRDDDEIFSRFSRASSKHNAFRPAKRIGDRQMRKLLTSKYWKVAPKLKDAERPTHIKSLSNDGKLKAVYHKRKNCYDHGKSKHDSLHKKRKLFNQRSFLISDGGLSSESVSNSLEKGVNVEKNGLEANFGGVNGMSPSIIGPQSSLVAKSSHVKFSIKSFKVPELYIEVPESATVGSLKRTITDAVTALFGGGLHVGVLHQGKKVRDDNKTLSQTGITHKENLDTLGFTLEPMPTEDSLPVIAESSPLLLCENPQPLNRCGKDPVFDSVFSGTYSEPSALLDGSNYDRSYYESATYHTDISLNKAVTDSKALVPVPPLSGETLAVISLNHKTKRSEFSQQRRRRRPFSVTEVEALVQAVEKLGTGRWRDIKLHAFEKADHRTYVDLKDKWKTLVHTANISPQQRRGEPVPQELLDRVLAAHAYWSQHQAKPLCKQQAGTLKNSEVQGDKNGVLGITLA